MDSFSKLKDKELLNKGLQQQQILKLNEVSPEKQTFEMVEDNQPEDSNEAKALVGKPMEEIRLRKLMKQKLQTTSIPKLDFDDHEGNSTKFEEIYDYHKFLGCGSFGFVVSAIDKASGQSLALKIVDTQSESSVQCIRREAEILSVIPPHPNVIRYHKNYIVLEIENARGGTLTDLIKNNHDNADFNGGQELKVSSNKKYRKPAVLTEEECAKAIKGILQGLKHIHTMDLVHRDLKPSNVVIDDVNNLDTVKLVDFGLAIKFQTRVGLDETCGTLVYQAPEQMFGETTYGKPVDIWAVGFIMYELISGQHPLWTRKEDKQQYKDKLRALKKIDFSCHKFSELAINLIEKLCQTKPSARYKADQALTHPWITRNFTDRIPRTIFEENIFRYEIDAKFRKCTNLVLFLSIVKNHDHINQKKLLLAQEQQRQEQLRLEQLRLKQEEERQQIEEEERLIFEQQIKQEKMIQQQKQQQTIVQKQHSDNEIPKETPDFISVKEQGLKLNASIKIETLRHEDDDEEDEKFLEHLKSQIKQKQQLRKDSLLQPSIGDDQQDNAFFFQNRSLEVHNNMHTNYSQSNLQDIANNHLHNASQSLVESENDKSSKSSHSYYSNNNNGLNGQMSASHNQSQTDKGNQDKKTGNNGGYLPTSDRLLSGKPPLAGIRENSASGRDNGIGNGGNSTASGGPRTQKSFRIHRTGKRTSHYLNHNNSQNTNTNEGSTKSILQNQSRKFSPSKLPHSHQQLDIILDKDARRQSQERPNDEVFSSKIKNRNQRRNSSLSNHRINLIQQQQQAQLSNNQSEVDSHDEYIITPSNNITNQEANTAINTQFTQNDFSSAMSHNNKSKKQGQVNTNTNTQKKKSKIRTHQVKRQRSAVQQQTLQQQNKQNQINDNQTLKFKHQSQNIQNHLPPSQNILQNQKNLQFNNENYQKMQKKDSQQFNSNMTGQYQQMSKNTLTSQEQQQTVSQLAQGKRQNSTVRNMLPVRKTLASETFDIIRHGPALKDKSPEVSPTRISNISYQESIIAQQYQLKPLNTFANIMPYSPQQQQDEFQDEDQQLFATGNNMHHMSLMSNGLVNSSTNVGSNGIPRRSNNPIPGPNNALSPFEQFLQNLMKQNELEKSSYQQVQRLNPNQFIQMQQPLEIQKRQRQMDNVIKKNTLSAQNSGKYSDKRIDDYYGSASTNSQSMTQVPPSQIANLQSKQRGMNKYGYPESEELPQLLAAVKSVTRRT
eukprot:403331274